MKISVFSDYNERNLSNSIKVNQLMQKIDIGSNCSIVLDLADCLIDYPNTSKLLDHVLSQLAGTECDEKSLRILCDFVPSKEIILNYLFVGSKFLKIEESKAYSFDELRSIVNTVMSEQRINFTIEEVNDENVVIKAISLQ